MLNGIQRSGGWCEPLDIQQCQLWSWFGHRRYRFEW